MSNGRLLICNLNFGFGLMPDLKARGMTFVTIDPKRVRELALAVWTFLLRYFRNINIL